MQRSMEGAPGSPVERPRWTPGSHTGDATPSHACRVASATGARCPSIRIPVLSKRGPLAIVFLVSGNNMGTSKGRKQPGQSQMIIKTAVNKCHSSMKLL
jgi:hypothetical protein